MICFRQYHRRIFVRLDFWDGLSFHYLFHMLKQGKIVAAGDFRGKAKHDKLRTVK